MSRAPTLHLAPDLDLPIEAATETIAILGKRGSGKTNTAVTLVEEMADLGQPVVVVDPTGVWWGLRSSASGTDDGLPVVIFGGEHADVPMDKGSGALIARVIVEQQISAVLDMTSLSKTAGRSFMADFLETLYHLNRDALHVVVDEADMYAPQRAMGDTARVLGAMEDLVRRGRAHGIGVTMITQRPAVLNKDVLGQAEVLVAMRMTGPRDVAAIDEWVSLHDVEDVARDVKASLPSLDTGEAWVWSPSWLGILQRVQIRARHTFDSSATPKPGQRRLVPKTMADIDVAALGEQITATVEQAKADDPRALRARIATLERELASANTKALKVPQIDQKAIQERVQAAMADMRIDPVLLQRVNTEVSAVEQMVERWAAGFRDAMRPLSDAVDALKVVAGPKPKGDPMVWGPPAKVGRPGAPRILPVPRALIESNPAAPGYTQLPGAPGAEPRPDQVRPGSGTQSGGHRGRAHAQPSNLGPGERLSKAERAILSVLAQHGQRTITQIALHTAYSHKSGGFRNALSMLRTKGYIEGRGDAEITEDGLVALGDWDPLPVGRDLFEWWTKYPRLGKAERAILDVLWEAQGAAVSVEEIAAKTGYSPTSGGFRNALSRLRTFELASGRGELALSPTLMGD